MFALLSLTATAFAPASPALLRAAVAPAFASRAAVAPSMAMPLLDGLNCGSFGNRSSFITDWGGSSGHRKRGGSFAWRKGRPARRDR